jgi:hypothetical protein
MLFLRVINIDNTVAFFLLMMRPRGPQYETSQ